MTAELPPIRRSGWPAHRRSVHERAASIGFEGWLCVLLLPDTCKTIGIAVPRWTIDLLEHLDALGQETPRAVLVALMRRSEKGSVWCSSRATRLWGLAMDLWDRDDDALVATSLGEVVADRWHERGILLTFGTLEGRVKVIAQHQLGVLHAQVQRERAESVGVTHFVWRTQGDDWVRDVHDALADQRFAYAKPPGEGLPGTPVNCRCWAESVIPDELLGGFGISSAA